MTPVNSKKKGQVMVLDLLLLLIIVILIIFLQNKLTIYNYTLLLSSISSFINRCFNDLSLINER